jgi:hypothetical protein
VTSILRNFPSFCLTLALASCAPKAAVVEETAAEKKEAPVAPVETAPETVPEMDLPPMPDNEIRVPGMLNLPNDNEFRASNPLLPGSGASSGSGVRVRPSTDPPSRVKPTE